MDAPRDWTGAGRGVRPARRRPAFAAAVRVVSLVSLAAAFGWTPVIPPDIILAGSGGAAAAGAAGPTSRQGATPATATPGSFRIAGGTDGLFPGATRPLMLTVSNPQAFAIVVISITASVSGPSAGCPGTLLAIPSFSGQLPVPAHGQAQLPLTATLSHAAPDACQGVVFPITYAGLARKG